VYVLSPKVDISDIEIGGQISDLIQKRFQIQQQPIPLGSVEFRTIGYYCLERIRNIVQGAGKRALGSTLKYVRNAPI
jgi:hypothetical protein